MTTLFIASGNINWASARMRCYWPAKYMDGARVETAGNTINIESTDEAVIFQKVASVELMRALKDEGRQVWWDACDPLWWFNPNAAREFLPYLTGVVCSNENLRLDFAEWCGDSVPSYTIPDRLELNAFPKKRKHADVSPVRLIWFGIAGNRVALYAAQVNLERLVVNGYNISLTIFDELPDERIGGLSLPVNHARWSLSLENEVLSAHDLAILPPYPGPWAGVKSNNRQLTAWASGLAVSTGINYRDLEMLVSDHQARAVQAAMEGTALVNFYDVRQSAQEWEALLNGKN